MARIARHLVAILVALSAATAHAQLAGLNHVLTAPGAMNTPTGIGSYISCTNGNTSNATIGVEVYGPVGNYLGGQSLVMVPFATIMWGTRASAGIGEDINLALLDFKGHLRVVASTGGKIVCTAWIADATSPGPFVWTNLSVVKKFTQK